MSEKLQKPTFITTASQWKTVIFLVASAKPPQGLHPAGKVQEPLVKGSDYCPSNEPIYSIELNHMLLCDTRVQALVAPYVQKSKALKNWFAIARPLHTYWLKILETSTKSELLLLIILNGTEQIPYLSKKSIILKCLTLNKNKLSKKLPLNKPKPAPSPSKMP